MFVSCGNSSQSFKNRREEARNDAVLKDYATAYAGSTHSLQKLKDRREEARNDAVLKDYATAYAGSTYSL